MKLVVNNLEETQKLAQKLAPQLKAGMTVLLKGPLGSGKTAFVKAVGKALGVERAIKSPTYTIVKTYELPGREEELVHVDAYRLEEGYAESIDLDAYLNAGAIIFIEWPQYVKEFLPDNYLMIEFELLDLDRRELTFSQVGDYQQTQLDLEQDLEQDWLPS